jgi:hypothetical protein
MEWRSGEAGCGSDQLEGAVGARPIGASPPLAAGGRLPRGEHRPGRGGRSRAQAQTWALADFGLWAVDGVRLSPFFFYFYFLKKIQTTLKASI